MALSIRLIPQHEFARVRGSAAARRTRLSLVADMCRANALAAVKRAGSGHLGSSFSAMDIVVLLYYEKLNTLSVGLNSPDRDIYFSSKGHDVPGLYAVLHSLGVLSSEKLMMLRRFGGLDGHPDVRVPGIEANSGSLGMGISKGRGIAWAKRKLGRGGDVFVMIGDGELQEGQNYEALTNGPNHRIENLVVIVDHNKVQTDRVVREISDLGDLERKFEAFGWRVARCDGHDFGALDRSIDELRNHRGPAILIADTIKGRGVSFMEHPVALQRGGGFYPWHAGAPDDESFERAHGELIERVQRLLSEAGMAPLTLEEVPPETAPKAKREDLEGEQLSAATVNRSATDEYVSKTYGEALVEMGRRCPELVVLDADLSADCKIRGFEAEFPDRFIENGIAEQDMVSMAGGLARHGLLPVVNSFASFLAARANEQIYNNATEGSKIIYACHYAGVIPAGPGKSHQSIRDISLFGALPNVEVIQPANAEETRMAVEYAVLEARDNVMLRLVIGPSPRRIDLPAEYRLQRGKGALLARGSDAIAFAYGPVMLHETLVAAEMLAREGFGLTVVNMPWLNRFDPEWLRETVEPFSTIIVVEDHSPAGGLGDALLSVLMSHSLLATRRLHKMGVEGFPACGTPSQALRYHRLDGESLAERVRAAKSAEDSAFTTVC
ncbi:MAG TPA: transketolase C-terminal domain-containing protein [Thermoanaerobaculia bacterium]|nr:transketolase C-terminal domain-containing protein [Thermoanaerobaculia bacterium]